MGVYEKFRDSELEQVIERESNERLLKDRHERLRKILRQRPQPRPESSSKNKGLLDQRHFIPVLSAGTAGATPLVLSPGVGDNSPMIDETLVWRGPSSQWKNFGLYLVCGLFCWLIVPIFIALARFLQTKCKIYELTTERLKITEGVFSKKTDTLELYRVKDIETSQPFLYRLAGIENIRINTTDTTTPSVLIDAIPSQLSLSDKLRNQVEAVRVKKGVRELDVE